MSRSAPIDRLRSLTAALDAGEPVAADDARWFAEGARAYIDGASRGLTLDGALGLAPMPYCQPWWETGRSELILRLVDAMPGKSDTGKAKAAAKAAEQYAARNWPRDEHCAAPPQRYEGKAEEVLFQLHRSGGRWPLRWRQISEIVRAESLQSTRLGLQTFSADTRVGK